MTNDEAINVLKNAACIGAAWVGDEKQFYDLLDAVEMAIEALKRETSGNAIDRQAAIRIASGYCHPANVAKELAKLPSVQPVDKDINVSCKDAISRQGAIDALELTTWYHQNRNGEMVRGANSKEDQAWYKAEDVYKVLKDAPSVQPEMIVRCKDCRWWKDQSGSTAWLPCRALATPDDFYCGRAERRTDEH